MRLRLSRRTSVALVAVAALAAALVVGFDRYVRARVAEEAERHHLDVSVVSVRPTWSGVRLVGVRARPRGVDAIDARFDEIRVDVARSGVTAVRAHGGSVDLLATESALAVSLRTWRAALPTSHRESPSARRPPISVEAMTIRWPARHLDATGAHARRDAEGAVVIGADDVGVEAHGVAVRAESLYVTLDAAHGVRRVTAARATVSYDALATATPSPTATPTPIATPTPTAPELRALRSRARELAALLASPLPSGADVTIDSLSIAPRLAGDGLSVGPGSLRVLRSDDRVTLTFATLPGATATPLALQADLPLDEGDVHVSLDGGPVPIALLGIRDGVAGLGDLDRATVEGKADLALASTGDLFSFDADLRVRDLALTQRRLAKKTLRGLHLGLRARGSFDAAKVLRLDETDLSMDRAHVLARGTIDLSGARAGASLSIEIPTTDCQALLDSAPAALLPTVQGVRLNGALAARAKVAFALRKIDDMTLDWSVDTTCKVTSVPSHLARDRFKRPFTHRLYSPRGEVREVTLGPGTPSWTPLGAMSRFLPISIVMTEDGGVFRRDGFNRAQIKYAVVTDLKERRFARGASTLTMQLAKNIFLSRDKLLARKLEELVLTLYLSQFFSKEEILELYLNVVELGPDVYGVRAGAAHYFGKGPGNLSLSESLFLASMLPSPVKLHGLKSASGVPDVYVASFHHLMDLAKQSGLISEQELEAGKAETIVFR